MGKDVQKHVPYHPCMVYLPTFTSATLICFDGEYFPTGDGQLRNCMVIVGSALFGLVKS